MAKPSNKGKFPLWLHPSGQWCKKIKGKHRYFGTDRDAALKRYVQERDDIEAGRKPRPKTDAAILADVVNAFLAEKQNRLDAGELSGRTWAEYFATCETLIDHFGRDRQVGDLRPDDFASLRAKTAKRLSALSLANYVNRVRVVFKFAFDFALIDVPVRYGAGFDRPAKKTLRLERAKKGPRLVSAADLWKLIDAADMQLRAMILLALNGGLGSTDCAQLRRPALDVRPGWVNYPRPKTGTGRRFPLWPETASVVAEVLDKERRSPRDPADADLVFLTRTGQAWTRFSGDETGRRSVIDSINLMYGRLLTKCGVKHPGGFYTLRHVHRTVADEVGDRPAVDLVMGHVDPSVASYYREIIADERLEKVVNHVRTWLLAGKPNG
jgi:integrase